MIGVPRVDCAVVSAEIGVTGADCAGVVGALTVPCVCNCAGAVEAQPSLSSGLTAAPGAHTGVLGVGEDAGGGEGGGGGATPLPWEGVRDGGAELPGGLDRVEKAWLM